MNGATSIFSVHNEKDQEIRQILKEVYEALKEKGYNPINQIVGYILSEDPTYITTQQIEYKDPGQKGEGLLWNISEQELVNDGGEHRL